MHLQTVQQPIRVHHGNAVEIQREVPHLRAAPSRASPSSTPPWSSSALRAVTRAEPNEYVVAPRRRPEAGDRPHRRQPGDPAPNTP
ncbi:hypothetical protein Slala05_82250 [Streptomyces lavendulae subsp. lavendulae]|nr:hypothetical protein Slala05_82250 [Streptomyces lavendulae subsp. lavendulae]